MQRSADIVPTSVQIERSAPARPLLEGGRISERAAAKMADFHANVIGEVAAVIASTPVVVVGMAQNPHVRAVRKALREAGVDFKYVEYGSYFSKWRERLAIKLWTGWPTFPQVFARGVLIGGEDLTKQAIADGTLRALIASARASKEPG